MSKFRRYDYLLSVLPALEPIGSVPPMSKSDLLQQVTDSHGPVRTVEMILLSDDIAQYQALSAGEIDKDQVDFTILSLDKAEDENILPDFLLPQEAPEEEESERLSVDKIWSRYFHRAASVAGRSSFLKAWIGFEVGLRNALAAARAHTLQLEPDPYLVAPELASKKTDYTAIISAWSAAANPLAASEVLDKSRWDWLDEHGDWYSFSASEIEAYTAKLVLLHHWRRILSDKQQRDKTNLA